MSYVNRTMIIPAHLATIARAMAEAVAGPPGAGMWTTALSPDGNEPASHYVSSGPIAAEFADLLVDGPMLHEAVGGQVPLTTCLDLIAMSTVVDIATEGPFDTFKRLGLEMVVDVDPITALHDLGITLNPTIEDV